MNDSITVYLDDNNKPTIAAGYYLDRLRAAFEKNVSDVELTDDLSSADIIHYNDLNIWASTVSGKKSRLAHGQIIFDSVVRYRDIPVIITDHGNIHATDAKKYAYGSSMDIGGLLSVFVRGTKRTFAKSVEGIITVSKTHKQSLVKMGLEPNKIFPVYHGVDEQYRNDKRTNTDDPFVLHVSNHGGKKNPDAVYQIAEQLDCRVVIAGGGWRDKAPDRLLQDDTIEIPGYVPENELIDLYNGASAFYLPTLYESFGLPLIEAMACGTAVVTTDVHAVPEVTGGAAVCCPPYDVDKHLNELERILEESAWRTELEDRALDRAEQFTWARTAEKTAEVYKNTIK